MRKKKTRKKLSNKDYKKILKFYKKSIPKTRKKIKNKAEKILTKKYCSCIEKVKVKPNVKGREIGICTNSVIKKKGFKRGRFTCKKKKKVYLYKGGNGVINTPQKKKNKKDKKFVGKKNRFKKNKIPTKQENIKKMELIKENGSYFVEGGPEMTEKEKEKPCCTKCRRHGYMRYIGYGVNKCNTCDAYFAPKKPRELVRCERWLEGGRHKKKTRKKRGGAWCKRKKRHPFKKNIFVRAI